MGGVPFHKSFLFRYTVAAMGVLAGCMLVVGYLSGRQERRKGEEDLRRMALVTARTVAGSVRDALVRHNWGLMNQVLKGYRYNPLVTYLALYDASGKCVWHSYRRPSAVPSLGEPVERVEFLQRKGGRLGVLEVRLPVRSSGRYAGAVVLGYQTGYMQRRIGKEYTNILVTLAAIFIVGGVVAYVLATRMYRPVRDLISRMVRVAEGDLDAVVEGRPGEDEFGMLVSSFNTMVKNLSEARARIDEYSRTLERRVEEIRTELEKAQERLIQQEKLVSLGRLAAGVAHEINNPLTSILGYTQLIEEELPPDHPSMQDLATVKKEVLRCKRIVENLLAFARRPVPVRRDCDVSALTDETIEAMKRQDLFDRVEFEKRYRPGVRADLDADLFRQVLTILFVNAAEAMPAGGRISVDLQKSDGTLALVVEDTGDGIPPEHMGKIFDPFFTTKPDGTGLGLSVLHGIVEQHGGRVEVESREGKGTVFVVEVPVEAGGEGRKVAVGAGREEEYDA